MDIINYIWAWLAVWLAGIWVAIWQWVLAKASVEVIWKRKEMTSFLLTVTILWIALIEAAAIYWLIIGFQLIGIAKLTLNAAVWAWLAVWLAWAWAWLGQWILMAWAIKWMDENPKIRMRLMTFMVLFVALIESAAIYGLVVASQIAWDVWFASESYIGMWLSVWLSALWVAVWHWILSRRTMSWMVQRSDMSWFLLTVTILWIALVESAVIYGLVVSVSIKELPLFAALWAWVAIWLTGLWAWIWEWLIISWWIQSIVRNPSQKTKIITFMVLFVALAEVTAIYWLIVSYQIIWDIKGIVDSLRFLWAWLAVWFAWLWVAVWIWLLAEESMKIMWQNPKMIKFLLTISILWVALLESAVIYWLVVAFQILPKEAINGMVALGSGLAIWLAWLWAWVWEGLIVKWAMKWMNKAPESKWKILAFMVLFVALVEVVAIYWLIIAIQGLTK